MGNLGRAQQARDYDVQAQWTKADLRLLGELEEAEQALPSDAPRALLSIRLSVFTEETTSPVRQELDLRLLARDRGWRVVGVASDLNTSATKVKPWERKELGKWIRDRVPEFDVLAFWKLDRFVRNIGDLNQMIVWAERYDKNLVSRHDAIDLTTPMGKAMVTFIAAVAEIEAANTSMRVASTWQRTKAGSDWTVGKPPYGYRVEKHDGRNTLVINEDEAAALHAARERLLAGQSMSEIVRSMKNDGLASQSLTVGTLGRRLRTPGSMGFRVEEDKTSGGYRRSQLVLDSNGERIRVGPPIFTQAQWDEVQAELDKRHRNQPTRNPKGATRFMGVLLCRECGTNMTVQQYTKRPGQNRLKTERRYAYLRCQKCPTGGQGAPHPEQVYEAVTQAVMGLLGHYPVQHREYARGEEVRRRVTDLEERIAYYMVGLEPGGSYRKSEFAQRQAEATLNRLIEELAAIDESTTEDRWVLASRGLTFREHWELEGAEVMEADLRRVGVAVLVSRTKVKGQRAPDVTLEAVLPPQVSERLIVKADAFAEGFGT